MNAFDSFDTILPTNAFDSCDTHAGFRTPGYRDPVAGTLERESEDVEADGDIRDGRGSKGSCLLGRTVHHHRCTTQAARSVITFRC